MSLFKRIFHWMHSSEKGVFFLLFIYTFFIRFPFFFRDYIDRDESTFILMGQSWVDGHLPYTQLWDIKPPLTFLYFAALIFSFGKSFIAIRFSGVLLVTVSSFFTYKITSRFCHKNLALIIGLLTIVLQSLFGSLQGVMSEHIAMAFLIPSIWLLIKGKKKKIHYLITGVLVGICLMVKLNLAYVGLFIGFFILISYLFEKNIKGAVINSFLYGIGILLIIGLTLVPYALDGESVLWWKSVILAPLSYAGTRQDSALKMAGFLLPIILFLVWGWKKNKLEVKNKNIILLILCVLATILAFIKGGRINGHYLILLYPFLLPLVGASLSTISISKHITGYVILLFLLFPMESYLEYYAISKNKFEKESFFNGEGVDVPTYLLENDIETTNILFFEYHIGYWLLGENPPTKAATHPSNILKEELFFAYDNPRKTGLGELKYLMETVKPNIVVTRKNRRVFDKKNIAANFYINLQLLDNYVPLDTVDRAVVYQRLELKK